LVISINLFLFPVSVSKRIVTPCNSNAWHALHITSYDGTSVCRTEIKSIESTQEETV
jgi:hypothetical protein